MAALLAVAAGGGGFFEGGSVGAGELRSASIPSRTLAARDRMRNFFAFMLLILDFVGRPADVLIVSELNSWPVSNRMLREIRKLVAGTFEESERFSNFEARTILQGALILVHSAHEITKKPAVWAICGRALPGIG